MDATRDCNYYQEQLSAYIDDELGRSERRSLDAHLTSCAGCQAVLARLRTIVAELQGLPRLQTGPDYLVALRRRIDRGDTAGESLLERVDWFRVNFALGAATLGVVAIVLFQSPAWQQEARWMAGPGAGQVHRDFAAEPPAPVAAPQPVVEAKRAPAAPAPAPVAPAAEKLEVAEGRSRREDKKVAPIVVAKASAAAEPPARKKESAAPMAPMAPVDSAPLARPSGLGLSAGAPVDLGKAFAAQERDVTDALAMGLNVGAPAPAGPATQRDPVLARQGAAPAPAEESADAESQLVADEAGGAVAPAASGPVPAQEQPPGAASVTHELLAKHLSGRVVSGSMEVPAKDRSDATILLKVSQLEPFLRALRDKAEELKVSEAVETSGTTFEFTIAGRGGKDGLESLAQRLSAFPGAGPAGLMFEKVPDAGDYPCRVMVTVE